MRKVLISIAALSAALAAAPSMAQSWGGPGGYGQPNYGGGAYGRPGDGRGAVPSPWQVRDLVERAIRNGDVSRREARDLREDVADLLRDDRRARRDGYDWGERRDIERQTREILRRLRDNGPGAGGPGFGPGGPGGPNGPRGDWRGPQGPGDDDYRPQPYR